MMKQNKLTWFAGMILCAAIIFGFARYDDSDVIKKVVESLDKWATERPQEKVYLHFDKPYYAIGDDIWFKAYITVGAQHRLSGISGVLNVELIAGNDSVKKTFKLPIVAGQASGNISLTSDSIKEGNYRLRAYTNWMRNSSEEYYFDKIIQVGNSIDNAVFSKVNYNYSTQNGQQKVNAQVTYTDLNGKPYPDKEVSYEVQLNKRTTYRGKGITDQQGNLNINFASATATSPQYGNLLTHIKLDPKQVVTKILPIKSISAKVDVQFFPESGYLVQDVRSKVAFKAVGADGLGVDINGVVVDGQNNEVSQIATQHLGMGYFWLVPESGKTYTAKINYPDGSTGVVSLPAVHDKGFVLSVSSNPSSTDMFVRVSLNSSTLKENQDSEINLVAQSGGRVVYAAKTKLEATTFLSRIPKDRFLTGITQLTLFSAKGEPLNERIIFMQNEAQANVALSTVKAIYAPREKVQLDIAAKTKDVKPLVGAFSLSVTNENKVQFNEADETTIWSEILLTSDIKGYVEKPNYYFTNVNDKTQADLDVLMLTQGYRRFEWKNVLTANYPPPSFVAEKALNISGTIKSLGGKPIPHGKVMLLSTTSGIFLIDTVADEQGHFIFKNLVFTDSVKFVIQARTVKDRKSVEITLDDLPVQFVAKSKNAGSVEVNATNGIINYLQNSKNQFDELLKYGLASKTRFLHEVSIADKRKPILEYSDNLNGPGTADQVIKDDALESCATLTQCLISKIRFVNFNGGKAYSTRSPGVPMLIIWDGMRMDPNFSLDDIPPNDVKSVEVLRSGYYLSIYGSGAGGGVLVVTTKRGEDRQRMKVYSPGIITYNPIGYLRIKEFYAPRYDDPKTNTKIVDLRSTIYWNPNIITQRDGTASVNFFNADSPGTYRAVIEGIDEEGNLLRHVFRYKVQ